MILHFKPILRVAQAAAWEAGQLIQGYYRRHLTIEWKADHSPVTEADRKAEQLLRTLIHAAYPQHGIQGEEEGCERPESPWQWILDPIDGTRSFARGLPLYGVQVAVTYEREPVVGVVYFPALNEMLAAAKDLGCTWNGRMCQVSPAAELSQSVLYLQDERVLYQQRPSTRGLVDAVQSHRNWGDCYMYALVTTGRAEAAMDPRVQVWDVAPWYTLLTEAGGTFTDFSGSPSIYTGQALASNGRLHPAILKWVQDIPPVVS